MNRRLSILWRFISTMMLFLAVPIAVFTVLFHGQLQDDFQSRVETLLMGSLEGFEASLRTELDSNQYKALAMASDRSMIHTLMDAAGAAGSEGVNADAIGKYLDHGFLVLTRDNQIRASLGGTVDSVDWLDPARVVLAAEGATSYIHADEKGLKAVSLVPIKVEPHQGKILVLVYRIHDALTMNLQSTMGFQLSISTLGGMDTVFSTMRDSLGYMQRGGLFDGNNMEDFVRGPQWNQILKETVNGQAIYSLYARTQLSFSEPSFFHLRMPLSEMQPLDASFYLISLSLIAFVLMALAGYILVRRVVRPLSFLSAEINRLRSRLRANEAVGPIRLDSDDEINDVAATFNALVRDLMEGRHKIDEQRAQIVSYAQNLEERVLDRTRELEEARIRAEIASTQKSRFLVNMNHELRTPLNSIAGITELLRFGAYLKDTEYSQALTDLVEERGEALPAELKRFLETLAASLDEELHTKTSLAAALRKHLGTSPALEILDALATEENLAIDQAYGTIHDASETLLNIINEVINLSRIESGVIEVRRELCRIRELLDSTMRHAASYRRVKGKDHLELVLRVSDALPDELTIDAQKVKQIILNLVTNAIKYTEKGSVSIDVSWKTTLHGGEFMATVNDTGRGIDPKDHDQLFMEFSRIFEVREIEGTGLGLALSRKLVERMGGVVGFRSVPGQGSSFWFTVPVNPGT